jgi:hypothetical protein
MNLSLANLKINRALSEETDCFSATIYVDGKSAGTVVNRGNGGCNEYVWNDRAIGRKVEAWAVQQPTEYKSEKLDQLIDAIRIDLETEQQLRRWMRKKTCFRLKGDERGHWRQLNGPLGDAAREFLKKQYGEKLEIILTPANVAAAVKL